jgi:hypothetical protein
MFLIRFITRTIGFLIVMRLMMGGPDLLFTGLVLVFWGPLVAVAVLLLGEIESTIGNYGTISTYIGIVLTSIGCFTPLLLTGGMFSPPLMPEWFWEKTSILWWAGWMATGLLMKNRSSPRSLAIRPTQMDRPARRIGAKLKIFGRKIGTNKINGLGAAENRCKDDHASPF